MTLLPVILSGGAGSRLWPVSRALYPKPFLRLPDGRTLLRAAFERATALRGTPATLLVTNRDYAFQCQDEFAAAGGTGELCSILEPTGRSTAPAIAMAAWFARARWGDDTVLLAIAADHLIVPQDAFQHDVDAAAALAREGWIATFGIRPAYPETGYGYIEIDRGRPVGGGFAARKFKEKPSPELAASFILDGAHYWNSGIFCMQTGLYLAELAAHQPELAAGAEAAWRAARERQARLDPGSRTIELQPETFDDLPDISVDYAVIEPSSRVAMVPASFEWSDIGSWRAVSELVAPDAEGNRIVGRAIALDTGNTFIQSAHRLTAAIGVQDLLIVDTEDALLVAHASRAQDVKRITDRLRAEGNETQRLHRTVHRPWGSFTVLEQNGHYKIKRLEIRPGGGISLQLHQQRSEHWVVAEGEARVTRGDEILTLRRNESTYIPAGTRHRLENPGAGTLIVVEVQTGAYLGEDDIERFEDRYGRPTSTSK
ncbi:MAG TPA: mannose-1-phosphate guanylyltransferase/mannose-6-phosphate isomerase [Dongiaceae bacterium]|nr:mannose-1-phosphate guanylyltransferase/mannose-6-phosphate isomerase [Dongiaceae bacterium]